MPPTFQDREQAFEAKFAHDEEFRFLVAARRDKLFAQWAAARLQLTDEATGALVKQILAIPDGPAHEDALLRHVGDLFSAHDATVSRTDLSGTLTDCMKQALKQLTEKPPEHSDIL
ncbi:MAG TPA: DUF1476 domain-containing protein [Acetobacteraceae bacterium]|nr:DUF1476 domain-containing protein [Acetobacteraceae bacterium]